MAATGIGVSLEGLGLGVERRLEHAQSTETERNGKDEVTVRLSYDEALVVSDLLDP
jgi:hypothetical protein